MKQSKKRKSACDKLYRYTVDSLMSGVFKRLGLVQGRYPSLFVLYSAVLASLSLGIVSVYLSKYIYNVQVTLCDGYTFYGKSSNWFTSSEKA